MRKIKYLILIAISTVIINVGIQPLLATSSPATSIQEQSDRFNKKAGFMTSDLGTIISLIIKALLSFLALIFLVLIIIAGFRWMTAAGNEQQIEKSQATIKAAAIGLVIVLSAYAITYFVFNKLPFNIGGPSGLVTSGPY